MGGLCEDHAPGAAVGPFFSAVLRDQFQRSRDGDRFWFENGQFTAPELSQIRGTSLSGLIERNTTDVALPASAFTQLTPPTAPAPAGGPGAGSELRSIDGGGNNPDDPNLGRAGQHLLANYTGAYGDGISSPSGDDPAQPARGQ